LAVANDFGKKPHRLTLFRYGLITPDPSWTYPA
jgi:hypothetical protein